LMSQKAIFISIEPSEHLHKEISVKFETKVFNGITEIAK
jgi:hypothetical protein